MQTYYLEEKTAEGYGTYAIVTLPMDLGDIEVVPQWSFPRKPLESFYDDLDLTNFNHIVTVNGVPYSSSLNQTVGYCAINGEALPCENEFLGDGVRDLLMDNELKFEQITSINTGQYSDYKFMLSGNMFGCEYNKGTENLDLLRREYGWEGENTNFIGARKRTMIAKSENEIYIIVTEFALEGEKILDFLNGLKLKLTKFLILMEDRVAVLLVIMNYPKLLKCYLVLLKILV